MSTDTLPAQLAETWRIHAHIHNVRLMWIKEGA